MICLGIESTAHTFGVGIIDDKGNILANSLDMFTTKKGGLIPNILAEHHRKVKEKVLVRALNEANISMGDVAVISYSHGPGLAPSLIVGRDFAVKLAKEYGKPLIGINHAVAHLTIGDLLCKSKNPVYLYVSGVNTQVIAFSGSKLRIFGETVDIGIGNAFDKFGRELGLGFPAGPKMEKLAGKGRYDELPYSIKGMDISFAGIITKSVRMVKQGKIGLEDACFSLQETCFAMLTEISERALAYAGKNALIIIGGVAANKRLCEMLDIMCKERGARFCAVPITYAGDQGVMIAWQGILEFKAGKKVLPEKAEIFPYERIDDVDVIWQV